MNETVIMAIEIDNVNITYVAALIGYTVEELEAEARYLLDNNRGAVATYEVHDGVNVCTGVVSKSLFESRFTPKRGTQTIAYQVVEK